MKKLLRKRTMFLVTLLVGLCMPALAQKDLSGTALSEDMVYYVRNAATGLYLKFGAEYGTHAAEGVAAHPVVFESNGDGTYAIASLRGYLASHGDAQGFMDIEDKTKSQWIIEPVGTTNKCYIKAFGRSLASSGNVAGSIYLSPFDANDLCQQWEIVKDADIRPAQAMSLTTPLDLTSLIKASSFDWVDAAFKYTAPYSDFVSRNSFYINNWVALDGDGNALNNSADDAGSWWAWYWDSNRMYDPTQYASSGVLRNGSRSAFTMSQNIGQLPAGTYTFSLEGFSRAIWELDFSEWPLISDIVKGLTGTSILYGAPDFPVYVEVLDASGNKLNSGDVRLPENTNISLNGDYHKLCIGGNEYKVNGLNKIDYAAAEFKANDDWKQNITFTLEKSTNIQIRLRRPNDVTAKVKNLKELGINYDLEFEYDLTAKTQVFVAFDNFTLIYHGTKTNEDPWRDLYYERVRRVYLNATDRLFALAENNRSTCTTNGCVHWDVWGTSINGLTVNGVTTNGETSTPTKKEAILNGSVIDTDTEFYAALAKIEKAYQAALLEHNSHKTDYTGDILNPSFEDGEYTHGWTLTSQSNDASIKRYTKTEDNVEDIDGDYLFKSPLNDGKAPGIRQTITGLNNGLYLLQAKLTADKGNYVYLRGNNSNDYIVAESPSKFEDASLYFLVEDGTATIGAVGGNNRSGRDTEYKYYYPAGGCAFKADHFRLSYVCDVPNGKLRLALDEANEAYALFDAFGQNSGIASTLELYEGYYEGKTATVGNIVGYLEGIHGALNTAAKAQSTIGADMTYAIVNPNFEWNPGNYDGWTTTPLGDTGVKEQNNGTYMTAGADGGYLFNTWNSTDVLRIEGCDKDDYNKKVTYTVTYESAQPITQTLKGLPKGTYRLDVMVASHQGEVISVTANENKEEVTVQNDKTIGEFVSVQCDVTDEDGTLEIVVGGESTTRSGTLTYYEKTIIISRPLRRTKNYNYTYTPWFKADNFRLTLVEPDVLVLDEKATFVPEIKGEEYSKVNVIRSIANTGNWSTFVLPFDANANALFEDGKCVVKALKSVEIDETGEHVSLTFGAITDGQIEAGKPYIIKNESSSKLKSLSFTDVTVKTIYTTNEQTVSYPDENGLMEFHGVYHRRPIPQGAFFINSNKFYEAVGPNHAKPDMISGFRGYFELLPSAKAQGARGFSFRIGEDETGLDAVNNDEVTVVAIYNLSGMRLNDMQEGVNILQMSNGKTIKVVIE